MANENMEHWQIETAERLASIERSIKYIEAHLNQLPQSAHCIRDFAEHDRRISELEEFRNYIVTRIAWVSGAFAAVAAAVPYLIELVKHALTR